MTILRRAILQPSPNVLPVVDREHRHRGIDRVTVERQRLRGALMDGCGA
jgi:hypothetical protein